jgi:hypothetical protein
VLYVLSWGGSFSLVEMEEKCSAGNVIANGQGQDHPALQRSIQCHHTRTRAIAEFFNIVICNWPAFYPLPFRTASPPRRSGGPEAIHADDALLGLKLVGHGLIYKQIGPAEARF